MKSESFDFLLMKMALPNKHDNVFHMCKFYIGKFT